MTAVRMYVLKKRIHRKLTAFILASAILFGMAEPLYPGKLPLKSQAASGQSQLPIQSADFFNLSDAQEPACTTGAAATATAEPTAEPAATPTAEPTATPTAEPTATAKPTVKPKPTAKPKKYVLTNPAAKLCRGRQKGIHYNKAKNKKIYHINSYTTDTVKLSMSHPSTFKIYGGASKKEVRNKAATVSSSGIVKSRKKNRKEKLYTIVEAVSKKTAEKQYIYICFREKLQCTSGTKINLYEKYTERLKFNYGAKKLAFSVSGKKRASVSPKGKVDALKHGIAYVTAKVKGSVSNIIRIKIVIKIEPWIVDDKNELYDYEAMYKDLHKLYEKYRGRAGLLTLGTTADKREILCMRIGKPGAARKLMIDAAIHGREWKNVQVIMRQTEEMLRDYRDFKERFQNTCIYIIPMDNPDGVSISQHGFSAIRNKTLRKLCKKIGHSDIWKANARGVDLNDNFPAGFSTEDRIEEPSFMGYPGKKAASEKETKALMHFVDEIKPDAVLNIHSTGSILYWDFDVEEEQHDKLYKLASKINSFNHYPMMPPSASTSAGGGFADWLNYQKGIVSITIETGRDVCPLPHSEYASIYKLNNKMFRWYMTKY